MSGEIPTYHKEGEGIYNSRNGKEIVGHIVEASKSRPTEPLDSLMNAVNSDRNPEIVAQELALTIDQYQESLNHLLDAQALLRR
jgi:hypothetical protein